MKILYLTNLYPPHHLGGYELICANVNAAMQARGHETLVLTSDHGVQAGEDSVEPGVRRELRVHGMYGHPWLGINALRSVEFHNNEALRQALQDFEPDVVHVFNLGGISKSLTLTLQRAGIPTVYFVSDHWIAQSLVADVWLNWWNRPSGSLQQRMLRLAWETTGRRKCWDRVAPTSRISKIDFRRIYFCSEYLRRETAARGYEVEHGAIIYNAVDTQQFDGLVAPASRQLRRLLYVGRLTADKGVETMLRGFGHFISKWSASLTICGSGDPAYEARLRSIVQQDRLPVEFVTANPVEMPGMYRAHDALIFPSEWGEPFALTPLEAMSSGLPVVATLTGGSAELFRDGDNAYTFKAGSENSLAAALIRMAAAPIERTAVAARGWAEVRTRFDANHIYDQVEDYVDQTVAEWQEVVANEGVCVCS